MIRANATVPDKTIRLAINDTSPQLTTYLLEMGRNVILLTKSVPSTDVRRI